MSLIQCSRVNKLWYYLSSHPELWRKLAQQKKWSFSSILLDQQQIESYRDAQGKLDVLKRKYRENAFISLFNSGKKYLLNDIVFALVG